MGPPAVPAYISTGATALVDISAAKYNLLIGLKNGNHHLIDRILFGITIKVLFKQPQI